MRMLRVLSAALATSVILAGCGPDAKQQATSSSPPAESAEVSSKNFGDYVIHFNAMSTDQLEPDVARAYNIARSKSRAMLNVTILKTAKDSVGMSVAGNVEVSAANLTGQIKNLTLRQIQEGDAVYYIGDVAIANGETLIFDIDATPDNETRKLSVRFSRQFFTD